MMVPLRRYYQYHVFKVELVDLENGDRGEGIYYMTSNDYIK